jgi:hypothetical protein
MRCPDFPRPSDTQRDAAMGIGLRQHSVELIMSEWKYLGINVQLLLSRAFWDSTFTEVLFLGTAL